jgi:anaerobic ribonucleoside-triphosphate reductase
MPEADKEGKGFAEKVLDYMRKRIADFQEETGNIYNLEATPAEGTSYRLAKIDQLEYPDIRSYIKISIRTMVEETLSLTIQTQHSYQLVLLTIFLTSKSSFTDLK